MDGEKYTERYPKDIKFWKSYYSRKGTDVGDLEYNVVSKPAHYYTTINGVEVDCLAAIEALGLQHHHYIASSFAYIWRCLNKDSTLTDLRKAKFFLEREISQREKAGES